eukprot:scaffold45441_cov20-Prasinocladus_malaysianus.AAC.1
MPVCISRLAKRLESASWTYKEPLWEARGHPAVDGPQKDGCVGVLLLGGPHSDRNKHDEADEVRQQVQHLQGCRLAADGLLWDWRAGTESESKAADFSALS